MDNIEITILDDGTIKVITDPISTPNHANAEQFLREMARLAGGDTKRERRKDKTRTHGHVHGEHKHQH